jgi:hypothetical protein
LDHRRRFRKRGAAPLKKAEVLALSRLSR